MEIEKKLIRKQSLETLYEKLKSSGKKIVAPVENENKVVFKVNPDYKTVTFEHIQTAQSLKNTVFPKIENLIAFKVDKEGTQVSQYNMDLIPETVLWGAHPCDAAGFAALGSIFKWDYQDHFFIQRLEKLTLISLSCHKSDNNCFCTSVGLNPGSTAGSDILLSRLSSGDYLAEIISEKGKKVVDQAPELFENAVDEAKNVNLTNVPQHFSHEKVTKNLAGAFYSDFWVENSLRCIGCGACAFVCPACACFDIQDETRGKIGKRLRSWDSCSFALFTVHTSGHNPREVQSQRWRQRIMHKFSYMPERNNSLGCLGCGRCSRACPVDMNILEQLAMLEKLS